jgi:hypothetical protein
MNRIQNGLTRRYRLAQSLLNDIVKFPSRLMEQRESRSRQLEALRLMDIHHKKELVVFFIPGLQHVTGGALQIFSLHRLTRQTLSSENSETVICWLPGKGCGWHMHKFDGFHNDDVVFQLEMVLSEVASDCTLLFHVPEFIAPYFFDHLGWERLRTLRVKHALRVNILNQNIEQLPEATFFFRLRKVIPDLTCTVGNPIWASASERQRLGIPLHILPTWYYPDDAPWQPFETKSNLMIVSPDANSNREHVLSAISKALPDLTVRVITGLKYEQYLELERRAKWSLTFGEGFDGYFYGPVLRGGVSFAVRNGTFDLPGFEDCRTIYPDYESMAQKIARDIRALDNKTLYEKYNSSIRAPITEVFSPDRTSSALAAFYRGNWTYP